MSEGCFIPSPCELLADSQGCQFAWCFERNCPVTYNALYAGGYVVAANIPKLVDGIPTMIQEDIKSWLFRVAMIQTVPYIATFIVLFIVLMITKVILVEVGIMLILLILLLSIICVLWTLQDSSSLVFGLESNIREKIIKNWDNNPTIKDDLFRSLLAPDTVVCGNCPTGCTECHSLNCIQQEGMGLTDDTEGGQNLDNTLLERYRQIGIKEPWQNNE